MDQLKTSPGGHPGSPTDAARIQAWNATQWLVRMTQSFAAAPGRHGDVGLRWCRGSKTIVTPKVAPNTALELSLATLTFQFLEYDSPSPHALDPDGKSSTEVEAWLLVEMLHRGFDREAFSKALPYSVPFLMTGDEAKYNPQSLAHELDQLAQRMADAAEILVAVRAELRPANADAQLLCWTESLDLGFTVPFWEASAGAELVRVAYTLGTKDGIGCGFYVNRETSPPRAAPMIDLPDNQTAERDMAHAHVVAEVVQAFQTLRKAAAN